MMTTDPIAASDPLDYFPCRYGGSRTLFRGPKQRLDGDYVAVLGGSDTYGRFVPRPYPALTEEDAGLPCVNFGWCNAGPDAFLNDPSVLRVVAEARIVVLQVMGAQNLSNRYYSVHPRRNDRFLKASGLMRKVYPDTDFTDYHFTRHMLRDLRDRSAERFALLQAELQDAWLARTGALIDRIGKPVVLLWFAAHAPDGPAPEDDLAHDPLFVTRPMIETLRPAIAGLVEVVASDGAIADRTRGMVFSELEAPAAAGMLGPAAHDEARAALAPVLRRILAAGVAA